MQENEMTRTKTGYDAGASYVYNGIACTIIKLTETTLKLFGLHHQCSITHVK